jgi:putative DNA primase/helicase
MLFREKHTYSEHTPSMPPRIEARHDALRMLHAAIFGEAVATPPARPPARANTPTLLDDAAVLQRARHAQNGAKFATLWAGETTGYLSPSEGDLALLGLLRFWTRDAGQLDRLFRLSGRMRDKWDARRGEQTYGQRTIARALAQDGPTYAPGDWPQTPPTQAVSPETPGPAVIHHVVPEHILHHPDPRVRAHWQRVYRRTALLKDCYAREGGLL